MSAPQAPTLIRGVGAIGIALLVLNSMIGAGIFALPGAVAARAGELSPWLFLAIGIVFITVVLSFSELASYFSESGGPILYSNAAFGPVAGFTAGWLLYVSRITAFAANATAMAAYLGAIWPWAGTDVGRYAFITLICGGLTAANYIGVREGLRTVALFTLVKLTPILLLVLLGLKEVSGDSVLPASLPDFDDFGGLTLLIIYAFVGFEAPTAVSGETRNARHSMPRSIVSTVMVVAVLYFLIMLVFVAVVPASQRADATLADVGRALMGEWGALAIAVAAVFSIGGNLAASMLSVPRLTFAMGELGMLPAWFGAVHSRFHTPQNSVLAMGSLCLVFALTGSFAFLAVASSLMRLLTYILCISALPLVRSKASAEQRAMAFRLPGGCGIPLVALALCVWIAAQAHLDAWLMTLALLGLGLLLYRCAHSVGSENAR
jgi:amino acid transporter